MVVFGLRLTAGASFVVKGVLVLGIGTSVAVTAFNSGVFDPESEPDQVTQSLRTLPLEGLSGPENGNREPETRPNGVELPEIGMPSPMPARPPETLSLELNFAEPGHFRPQDLADREKRDFEKRVVNFLKDTPRMETVCFAIRGSANGALISDDPNEHEKVLENLSDLGVSVRDATRVTDELYAEGRAQTALLMLRNLGFEKAKVIFLEPYLGNDPDETFLAADVLLVRKDLIEAQDHDDCNEQLALNGIRNPL